MATSSVQARAWGLAGKQHGVISHAQLLELGFSVMAIRHRVAIGRLHRVRRGVYAVGRPQLTREGEWMAAVLSCGVGAVLSHETAAAHLGLVQWRRHAPIHVSVPDNRRPRQPGIRVHRRTKLGRRDVCVIDHIPVTSPVLTLIDIATCLSRARLEEAVNKADKLNRIDPPTLRKRLGRETDRPGAGALRRLLDAQTFRITESALERKFLALVRDLGLPRPETQRTIAGHRVDFYWPQFGLVVETDGLRYHRTPAQQARDRKRDQDFAAAGLTCLRFTHAQVAHDIVHVRRTLMAVTGRFRLL